MNDYRGKLYWPPSLVAANEMPAPVEKLVEIRRLQATRHDGAARRARGGVRFETYDFAKDNPET